MMKSLCFFNTMIPVIYHDDKFLTELNPMLQNCTPAVSPMSDLISTFRMYLSREIKVITNNHHVLR